MDHLCGLRQRPTGGNNHQAKVREKNVLTEAGPPHLLPRLVSPLTPHTVTRSVTAAVKVMFVVKHECVCNLDETWFLFARDTHGIRHDVT